MSGVNDRIGLWSAYRRCGVTIRECQNIAIDTDTGAILRGNRIMHYITLLRHGRSLADDEKKIEGDSR